MTNPTQPVFLHPHEQAALGLTAPLTAEVVAMVARLRTRLVMSMFVDRTDLYNAQERQRNEAADMLTALSAQLAERDAELARVTEERDSARETLRMVKAWDFPGDLQDIAVRYETATRRIAALTEALTNADLTIKNLLEVMATPDQQQCCDGRMCGCMGSTVYQEAEHYARQDLAMIAAALTTDKEPTT